MQLTVPRWFERLVSAGVLPTDDAALASRKRLAAGAAFLAPFMLVSIGAVYMAYHEWAAGSLYVTIGTLTWVALALFSFVHHSLVIAFWMTAPAALVSHLLAVLALGDLVHSGGVVLWGLAYPVATGLVFVGSRQMIPLYVMYAANIAVTTAVSGEDHSSVPSAVERGILLANLLALSAFAVVILVAFIMQRDRAYQLLDGEQRRARALLLSILPEEIADELTHAPRVIADEFENVSVLFCDVVGFTPMSESMSPAELVEMLDELFGHFDALVDELGLEKIKTIDDCYMVAAGIPRPREDHARALVTLALRMLATARDHQFHGRVLQLRIGVNSGSVVAGVIGRRKFSYDLWGDVVNTASRMESHGVPGSVQVTESTRNLVDGDFECTSRGTIDVRGKGALPVWLVAART